jgi:hypothetical protein
VQILATLRRIFGPERDEVTGGWRKPHNEELHNLYSSPNIIGIINSRRMRRAGHVARMGSKRNICRYRLESQMERKKPRLRWVDNIKMDHTDIVWGGMPHISYVIVRP